MLELYVTGKNSEFVIAGLAATMQGLGYSTCVYKPIQTNAIVKDGYLESPFLSFIKEIDSNIKTYFSYLSDTNDILEEINLENIYHDYESIRKEYECIITAGTFSDNTYINENITENELVQKLKLPVLLVLSENTINKVNDNQETNLRGIIIPNEIKNIYQIEQSSGTKVLGILPKISDKINANDLISNVLTGMDIEKIFSVQIAKLNQ